MSTAALPEREAYEQWLRRGDVDAVRAMCGFFMEQDPVHQTLRKIAAKLDEIGVAYAVAGGMALAAHRFVRATVDVDVLVSREGLRSIHERLDGLGYVRAFRDSRSLRDVETGVRIEFLVEGDFPGDGRPKPVAFPQPRQASEEIRGVRYLRLPALIELKLASGMTNAGRLKDLADVQELIRTLDLRQEFAQQLHPYVREKYLELWRALASAPDGPGSHGG